MKAAKGKVVWNGRDGRNRGDPPGMYRYRVEAIDRAGNSAISTESTGFLVLLPGVPR